MIYSPTKMVLDENPIWVDSKDTDNPIFLVFILDQKLYVQENDEDDI